MVAPSYATPMICVVDDSEDDLLVLKRSLRRLDITNPLKHFLRAEQAYDFLGSDEGASALIGLLLVDINLPGNDGFTFLRDLRASNEHRFTPAVMFTTSDAPRDIQTSYEAGANAFVTKPVATAGFTEAVNSILAFWLRTARLPQNCLERVQ